LTARLSSLLFPAQPREFPGRRALKILLRAVHVLSAGILTGLYIFEAGDVLRDGWLMGAIGSGALLLLLDLHESGAFLLQVRGLVVVGKIAVLAMLPMMDAQAGRMLAALVVASVLSSHAPATVRYFVPFGGNRLGGAKTKG
jgi:hypothetical protein